MPKIVVAGALIQCKHGGTAKLPQGDRRLQIGQKPVQKPVVTAGMEAGVSFEVGTPNVVAPCLWAPGGVKSPCTATMPALPPGVSTQLTVGEAGALLESANGTTVNASGPATWSVLDPGQTLFSVDH
jgi:hypothetical protein